MKNKFFMTLFGMFMVMVMMVGCGGGGSSSNNGGGGGGGGGGGATASNYVTAPGSTFVAGQPPAASTSVDAPVVDNVTAPTNMINGGSATYTVNFHDPNGERPLGTSGASTIVRLIIFVQGDVGYLTIPISSSSGGTFTFTISTNANLNQNLVIVFAVVDADGHVSVYISRNVTILHTGTGDVKVSVSWDQPEDLDLHVFEPGGEEIYYAHDVSATGGTLDMDSNPACSIDNRDNENIYWPTGAAPHGTYQVDVVYYEHCTAPHTNFTVTVIRGGDIQTFHGTFEAAEGGLRKIITTFTY
jgi:hypothetical protein